MEIQSSRNGPWPYVDCLYDLKHRIRQWIELEGVNCRTMLWLGEDRERSRLEHNCWIVAIRFWWGCVSRYQQQGILGPRIFRSERFYSKVPQNCWGIHGICLSQSQVLLIYKPWGSSLRLDYIMTTLESHFRSEFFCFDRSFTFFSPTLRLPSFAFPDLYIN